MALAQHLPLQNCPDQACAWRHSRQSILCVPWRLSWQPKPTPKCTPFHHLPVTFPNSVAQTILRHPIINVKIV